MQKSEDMGAANVCVRNSQYDNNLTYVNVASIQQSVDVHGLKKKYYYGGVEFIAGYPHIEKYMEAIIESPKLKFWIDNFDSSVMEFKSFIITDADFFGPVQPDRLGFYKGKGDVVNKITKEPIPAIAFNRGECVACLIIISVVDKNGEKTGQKVIPLCQQLRFAGGRMMTEIPAGMKDARTKSLKGPVLDEIREETGIVVNEDDMKLIKLGEKIFPSPGGSDEAIDLWLYETEVSEEELRVMEIKTFGEGKYEKIKIKLVDSKEFDDVLDKIGDVKAECAWRRYKNLLTK
jgi:hypothetical protein